MTAVLFDLDGTLIDSLTTITAAANAVLGHQGLSDLPESVVAGFVGLGEEVFVDRLIAATDLAAADRSAILGIFMEHYALAARDTKVFPGVKEALEELASWDVQMGLVTNKPRVPLQSTLAASGLEPFFKVIVAGDDLEKRKPDPMQIIHAGRVLRAQTCVYVGDSETDAAAAQNADVPFLLFSEGIRVKPLEEIPHHAAFSEFQALPALFRDRFL